MSYRLSREESIAEGLRRILTEERRGSILQLARPRSAVHEGIHEARKSLKRSRAVIRIVRPRSRGGWARAENHRLRDIGRRLSDLRDLQASVEAIERVRPTAMRILPPEIGHALTGYLEARRDLRFADEEAVRLQLAGALQGLVTFEDPLPVGVLRARGVALLRPGLVRAKKRAQKAFRRCLDEPTVEMMHDFRKRVKDLGYGMRLIRGCSDPELERIRRRLKSAATVLGEERDLTLLRELLLDQDLELLSRRARRELGRELDRQQARLRLEACDKGELALTGTPEDFGHHVTEALRRWRRPSG